MKKGSKATDRTKGRMSSSMQEAWSGEQGEVWRKAMRARFPIPEGHEEDYKLLMKKGLRRSEALAAIMKGKKP